MASRNVPAAFQIGRCIARTFCTIPKRSESEKLVAVKEKDGVRTVRMNHPPSLNSLSLGMINSLIESIQKNTDSVNLRSIVIASVIPGKVFSAGHNLKELTPQNSDQHKEIFDKCSELMRSISQCPVPVIAAVDGLAAAAGCQLAAACDITVCTERTMFSTPGTNVGIFCSTPGIPLVRNVPRKTAMYMLFTGLPITAAEALRAGLVSKVVPNDMLQMEVDLITGAINMKSRSITHIGKQFLYEQIDLDTDTAYTLGTEMMVANLKMDDAKEGIKSFLEKTKPEWKHTYLKSEGEN